MQQMSTKEKKQFMLHLKGRNLRREAKHIGHLLSLVTSEEDDARLWEKYTKVLERSQELEEMSGYSGESSRRTTDKVSCKPVFDEAYLSCTRELSRLYALLSITNDPKQRRQLHKEIDAKKKERWETSAYVNRETGEPVKVYVSKDGTVNFVYDNRKVI